MTPALRQMWPYLILAIVAYVLFLIVDAPAAWISEAVARGSGNRARLLGAHGSVWNGSGTLVFNPGSGSAIQTRTQWHLQPFWLFAGQVRATVRAEGDVSVNSQIAIGYQSLRAIDLAAEIPATHAQAFYTPAMLISPTGKIAISAANVSVGKSGFNGELMLKWTDAGSKLGAATNLGDYTIIVTGSGGPADVRVETVRGDFRVNARGNWQLQADGLLNLDGEIIPGSREAAFGPLLAAANIRKSGDRYPLRVSNRVPLPAFLTGQH